MQVRERRTFRFTFQIGLPPSGLPIALWVPRPVNDGWQRELGCALPEGLPCEEGVDPESTNRTLRFTLPPSDAARKIEVSFDVERRLRLRTPPPEQHFEAPPADDFLLARYLQPNLKVPLDGPVAQQAHLLGAASDPPVLNARRAFDSLLQTVTYDRGGCTPERMDQLGDLYVACDLKTGTCTEFHGLFVGYMRVLQVPARFNFGFNLPPDKAQGAIAGYHCWSEFYLPDGSWMPVDVSEAWKRQERAEPESRAAEVDFYFGSLDANRVAFTWDRDVWLAPRQQGPRIDKFIFPYAEAGDAALKPELTFRFRDL